MKFVYTPALKAYMKEQKKSTIVVELVIAQNSEFEIAELHVHLIDDSRARDFKEKQGYGIVTTEEGEVLLPRFKLKYEDTITFDLRKILWFKSIRYEGIRVER